MLIDFGCVRGIVNNSLLMGLACSMAKGLTDMDLHSIDRKQSRATGTVYWVPREAQEGSTLLYDGRKSDGRGLHHHLPHRQRVTISL